jgi:hypothetical protein
MRAMMRPTMPIPDRIRGAALAMVLPSLMIAAMPVGILLGLNFAQGIGITTGGQTVVILPSMLPWLAPLAAATFVVAIFVYFGLLVREGLVIAIGWTLGLLVTAPVMSVFAALVAFSIWSGRRRMEAGPSAVS